MSASRTVLVVDDEVHIVNIVEMKFKQAGFRVLTARDPQSAFDTAQRENPDLVVSDHHMPGGSGIDLCRLLKSTPGTSQIPVILLTAYDFSILADEVGDCNIGAIMPKPFSPRELVAKATAILESGVQPQGS